MGQVASRVQGVFGANPEHPRGAEDEDPEIQTAFSNVAGSYFGSHFLMCGGRFEMSKPEAFLFGENGDLDLLGNRAVTFPYPSPLGSDEVHPLNLLINIRKESVKFTRVVDDKGKASSKLYRLEFVMDTDCACTVQVHFNAREFYQDGEVHFGYRNKRVEQSEVYRFDIGADQHFRHFVFDSSEWQPGDLTYNGGMFFPFVIVLKTDGVAKPQLQSTMCTVETANDSSQALVLKPLRQKIACDGVIYLLQEIFGIENKENTGDALDDGGLECIICMSDVRDTVILPCRHLCICNNCADTLRYKLNNCPICRSPFRALIQLRARRQARNQGYETVTLVEGLNGPQNHQCDEDMTAPNAAVNDTELGFAGGEARRSTTSTKQKKRGHARQHSRSAVMQELAAAELGSRGTTVTETSETSDGIELKSVRAVMYERTSTSTASSRSSSPSPSDYVEKKCECSSGHRSRSGSERLKRNSATNEKLLNEERGTADSLSDAQKPEETVKPTVPHDTESGGDSEELNV